MSPSRTELVGLFDQLSDEELERRAGSGALTALAQEVALEELARRGMAAPAQPAKPAPVEAPEAEQGERRFVLVGRFLDPMDAQTLRARLEAEGIPVVLPDANHNQAFQLIAPVLGGVRVEVPEQYAEDARRLVESMNTGTLALAPGEEGEVAADAPTDPDALFSTDRRRLREILAMGLVLMHAGYTLLIPLVLALRDAGQVDEWEFGTCLRLGLPLAMPLVYFTAAVLFALRSRWSLLWFGGHVLATLALYLALSGQLPVYLVGSGMVAAAISGLILYYGVYLLGQGRLR